jgi:hypothetical protein
MADMFVRQPRRASGLVEMHPADIVRYFETEDCLKAFNEDELEKIAFAVNAELQSRQPQLERNNADIPA